MHCPDTKRVFKGREIGDVVRIPSACFNTGLDDCDQLSELAMEKLDGLNNDGWEYSPDASCRFTYLWEPNELGALR
eukprot:SAG11_NODE_1229_length_5462_cov_12.053888_8_plen_75_part_01